jgi:predicted permease
MFSVVASLAFKIFPLYVTMFFGFIASKYLGVLREVIAPLIVYIFAPMVVFYSTYQTNINKSVILLPFIFFSLCALVSFLSYIFAKRAWSDNTKNLVAFSAGTGNLGYFGIPLAFILLSHEAANIYIFTLLVSFFYEYTIGFYIISRGNFTLKQSLVKIFKLPVIYAFLAGLTLNLLEIEIPIEILSFMELFKGAYVILGMMMVGMGLSSLKIREIDVKFIFVTNFMKLVFWPIVVLFVIWLDENIFHIFYKEVYQVLIVASIVPMAANTVTLATLFKTKPEQAAIAVFLSTIFAFFTIPIFASFFI